MTTYQQISQAISNGKSTAITWADLAIDTDNQGGQSGCLPLQLCVLTQWIGVLEDYLDNNFDSDGNEITPDEVCLTLSEVLELVGKVNSLSC